jgi:hypothetical protein
MKRAVTNWRWLDFHSGFSVFDRVRHRKSHMRVRPCGNGSGARAFSATEGIWLDDADRNGCRR